MATETKRTDPRSIRDWFPLYASDWLTSMGLRLCSPIARGILIDLMAYSWQTGTPGTIIENDHDLSLFFHCTEAEFSNAIAELDRRGCIACTGGNIIIHRLQSIAAEQTSKHELRQGAGRLGGLAKAQNRQPEPEPSSNALANPSNALAVDKSRVEKSRKEESRKDGEQVAPVGRYIEDDAEPLTHPFDAFWEMYDLKKDRDSCLAYWTGSKKLNRGSRMTDADRAEVMRVLPLYIAATPDKQYRKGPASYLYKSAWKDEIVRRDDAQTRGPASGGAHGPEQQRNFGEQPRVYPTGIEIRNDR